ncbi:MAG: hypothetical protein J0L75_11330, partial [Spirochaetes bacterium]|nr:hypothetical protein [Spirochaetota bacterium]
MTPSAVGQTTPFPPQTRPLKARPRQANRPPGHLFALLLGLLVSALAAAPAANPTLNDFFDLRDEIDLGFSHLLTNQHGAAFAVFSHVGSNLGQLRARIAAQPDRPLGDLSKVTNKFPVLLPGDNPVVSCRKELSIAANAYLAGLHGLSARSLSNVGLKVEEARDYTASQLFQKQKPEFGELRELLSRLSNDLQALQAGNRAAPAVHPAEPDTNLALLILGVSNEASRNALMLQKIARELTEVDTRLLRLSNSITVARMPSGLLSNLLVSSFQNLRSEESSNQALLDNLRELVSRQQAQIEELGRRPPPAPAAPVDADAPLRQRQIEHQFLELQAKIQILIRQMEIQMERGTPRGPAAPAERAPP